MVATEAAWLRSLKDATFWHLPTLDIEGEEEERRMEKGEMESLLGLLLHWRLLVYFYTGTPRYMAPAADIAEALKEKRLC